MDPSSTTTTSIAGSNAWIPSTTDAIAPSSSNAGTTATIRRHTRHRRLELEQPEHLTGPVRVRVLVEDALPRPSAHRRGAGRIVEQGVVRVERRVGVLDDDELLAGLEPPLEPAVGVRDDRGARRRQLERPAGRRAVDGRVRAPRDVEVDARRGDRAREHVERHVAEHPRIADVALEVPSAEGEVDPRVTP